MTYAFDISVLFAWYDLWVGFFYDRRHKTLYTCPLPCLVIRSSGAGSLIVVAVAVMVGLGCLLVKRTSPMPLHARAQKHRHRTRALRLPAFQLAARGGRNEMRHCRGLHFRCLAFTFTVTHKRDLLYGHCTTGGDE